MNIIEKKIHKLIALYCKLINMPVNDIIVCSYMNVKLHDNETYRKIGEYINDEIFLEEYGRCNLRCGNHISYLYSTYQNKHKLTKNTLINLNTFYKILLKVEGEKND